MKRTVLTLLVVGMLGVPIAGLAQQPADSFSFPVDNYASTLCFDWGRYRGESQHVAQDVQCHNPGAQVRAAANGQVMLAEPHGSVCREDYNWGTIVVIEHTLPGGEKVCTIYGHIAYTASEGAIVTKNQAIGSVEDFSCPEGWTDHLHFGVYNGSFGAPVGTYPSWLVGYLPPATFPGNYLKPDDFINSHQGPSPTATVTPTSTSVGGTILASWANFPDIVNLEIWKGPTFWVHANTKVPGTGTQDLVTAGWEVRSDYKLLVRLRDVPTVIATSQTFSVTDVPVGYFSDGWHDDGTSQAFADKYVQLQAAGHLLGTPWDNGGSIYVHDVNGMLIQDFIGPSNGYNHPYTALIMGPNGVHLLKEGFWDHWMNNAGWVTFGPPVTDEEPGVLPPRQGFLLNDQNLYFRWDESSQSVYLEDDFGSPVGVSEITVSNGTTASLSGQFTANSVTSTDGVFHSQLPVAEFGTPFDLVNGRTYDGFYALISGEQVDIDPFTVTGDRTIVVDRLPNVEFYAENTNGVYPFTAWFHDQSSGNPTSWLWDFGDGQTSPYKNPSHTYLAAGDYTVTLTAYSATGQSTKVKPSYIHVGDQIRPTAAFNATPLTGLAPLTVYFYDQSSGGPDYWYWQFGDGETSNERNPVHTFTDAGSRTVELLVSNQYGANDIRKTSYIQAIGIIAASFTNSAGFAPAEIVFTDTSTPDPTSWFWDFGDGLYSTEQNPTHLYQSPGDYSVTLVASNSLTSDHVTKNVHVKRHVFPDFSADATYGPAPLTVSFTDLSQGNPASWSWDFGDGTSSCCNIQNPSHTYSAPGVYEVRLDVDNGDEFASVSKPGYIVVGAELPNPCLYRRLDTTGYGYDVEVTGSYICMAAFTAGVQIIDISDPAVPVLMGNVNPGIAYGIATKGDYAFVASLGSRLHAIDISNPVSPTEVHNIATPGQAFDVAIDGDHAYVGSQYGLTIVNITDPSAMVVVGVLNPNVSINGLDAVGRYVYCATPLGLQIVDVIDPSNPVTVGTGGVAGLAYCAAAQGSYVYLCDQGANFDVVDVSTPSSPILVGSVGLDVGGAEIRVEGNVAYVADNEGGLQIVDVSLPSAPAVIRTIGSSSAEGVTESGSYIYVADGTGGLAIFEKSCDEGVFADFAADVRSGKAPLNTQFSDASEGNATSWLWHFGDGDSSQVQNPGHTYAGAETVAVSLTVGNGYVSNTRVKADYIGVEANPIPPIIGLMSTTHQAGEWSNVDIVDVEWVGPTGGGIAGYSYDWTTASGSQPDSAVDQMAVGTASSPLSENPWYFHIKAIGQGGEQGAVSHLGPFKIDATPPWTMLLLPNGGEILPTGAPSTIVFKYEPYGLESIDLFCLRTHTEWVDGQPVDGSTDTTWIASPSFAMGDSLGGFDWTPTDTTAKALIMIVVADSAGNSAADISGRYFQISPWAPTAVPEGTVRRLSLGQNTPNPARGTTLIGYSVREAGDAVQLKLFDIRGRLVRTLLSGPSEQLEGVIRWDGRNDRGVKASAGVYFYRMESEGHTLTRRLILLD
jgi:PKD repeat protein